MKLYKNILYRLSKKDTPLVVTERIGQAFHAATVDPHAIKFFVNDWMHGVSGIDRLLKLKPTLFPYCHIADSSLGHEKRLSNLPARWYGANPDGCIASLQMEDVFEIVSGIPRRYPLNSATFVFDCLSILSRNLDSTKEAPIPFVAKGDVRYTRLFTPSILGWSDYPSPCIRLQSDWRISGRANYLDAIVENTKYSNGGLYTITRETNQHHLIKLTFVRGKFSADVSCMGSIEGPLWKHEFGLPAAHTNRRLYRVTRQIDVDRQIGNIAAAYDSVEKRIVEAIDGLYGVAPVWLPYL